MLNPTLLILGCKAVPANRSRSLFAILGLALGIGLYVAITVLADGYARLISLPFTELKTDLIVQRAITSGEKKGAGDGSIRIPFSNQPITGNEIDKLRHLDGVALISPSILLWHQTKKGFSVIAGVESGKGKESIGSARIMDWIKKGRRVERSGEVVVKSHFARFHKLKLGDEVNLGGVTFKIVGIAALKQGASIAASDFYISRADAGRIAHLPAETANLIFVRLQKGSDAAKIQKKLSTLLPGSMASTADNIGDIMKGMSRISGSFAQILGWVSLLFTSLIGFKLISGTIHERGDQIGLLKTVGWQRSDIIQSFMAEAAVIGLIGGLLGIALGYALAAGFGSMEITLNLPWNLSPTPGGMAAHVQEKAGKPVAMSLAFLPLTTLIALIVACTVSTLSGIFISGKLAKMKVRQALNW